MIIDHDNPDYKARWESLGKDRWNGAYYYSREIVENIIPNVITDRNWITVNQKTDDDLSHSIVFIHSNTHPHIYDWIAGYSDMVLVCGVERTCKRVGHLGKAIYLPLSIDVPYVESFRTEKTKGRAFVGRESKKASVLHMKGVDVISGMPRDELLRAMAPYRELYAVGRCALEAKVLGADVLSYDARYPNPAVWEVLDNRDAAKLLQTMLDEIDGRDG